jgi:hypothetical protein
MTRIGNAADDDTTVRLLTSNSSAPDIPGPHRRRKP